MFFSKLLLLDRQFGFFRSFKNEIILKNIIQFNDAKIILFSIFWVCPKLHAHTQKVKFSKSIQNQIQFYVSQVGHKLQVEFAHKLQVDFSKLKSKIIMICEKDIFMFKNIFTFIYNYNQIEILSNEFDIVVLVCMHFMQHY